MTAVSDELLQTILGLQQLPSLLNSSLGGGTGLAIRYDHRVSHDIDLFFAGIIGKTGYEKIRADIQQFYTDDIFGLDHPCDIDDQFMFLRFYIRRNNIAIKVEVLQNMQTHRPYEMVKGVRMMHKQDIAILKLLAACDRGAQKDIFDLDFITDDIPLPELMELYEKHRATYDQQTHKTIFDLDGPRDPIVDPNLLLKFEEPVKGAGSRPGHSNPRIDIIEGNKNWASAKSSWRRKVRAYFAAIGTTFPSAKPQ